MNISTARSTRSRRRKKTLPPTTAEDYFSRSTRFQDLWIRVTQTVSKMRSEKLSLTRAAHELGVSTKSVKRWGKSALRKKGGRFVAKPTDRLLRVLNVQSTTGPTYVAVRDSKEGSILGAHSSALGKYVATGSSEDVLIFEGYSVTDVDGNRVELLTDLREIDRLANAGVLEFHSLYLKS